MADFRPFRGLRYRSDVIGDAGATLAPPYDVIDAKAQAALHEGSPYNIIRLELGEERADDSAEENRYTRAAAAMGEWLEAGAIVAEEEPAFYLYVHEFEHEGKRLQRRALLGRLRLEPWAAGVMRPHEETMAGPKADRLQLLRALRTQVSPVLALYRDPGGSVAGLLGGGRPVLDATTPDGQRHVLTVLSEPSVREAITAALESQPLYMLDGHHRYETALTYQEERRSAASGWTGDEPANFVMVALTAVDDPGLVLLPIHRLVRPPSLADDLTPRLDRFMQVEDTTPKSFDGTALLRLMARLHAAAGEGTAIGALGLEESRLHLLKLRDASAVQALMPERSAVWRSLDVNVLEYAVLREALGLRDGNHEIAYTEDAEHAMREVESGRWPLAFLLNPTRVEEILAVADAGERMPAKSTFFYPKLATGLVLNPLD